MSVDITALQNSLKRFVKGGVPRALLQWLVKHRSVRRDRAFSALSVKDAFTKIYRDRLWGEASNGRDSFSSGSGSRHAHIVAHYVEAVERFVTSLGERPDALDLGCGDFFVGSQVRHLCANYVACDIVDSLIERNERVFADMNVSFRVLDATSDELPDGDLVFMRQVLQHLSNDLILRVIHKIAAKYKYLVVTEHLPSHPFVPNVDKPTGPGIRLALGSGIVLTEPPFSLRPMQDTVLCQVAEADGLIQTRLYTFSA